MRIVNHPQRGAVMALTAICLVVLLGAAALAVDVSLGWQTRRNLVTSTDAAALAAAQTYSKGGNGCANDAAAFLASNAPSATMTLCTTGSASSGEGTVTVSAVETVDVYFGRVIGLDPYPANSSTTALWGSPKSATGLRPVGLCADALDSFFASPNSTQTLEISYDDQGSGSGQIEFCGSGNPEGNWGIVDFGNDANSAAQIKDELMNGYPLPVYTGTIGGDCTSEPKACYEGSTGQGLTNAYKNQLGYLKNNNIYFSVPIFDFFTDGAGANLEFHLVAFARVRIIDYKLTGSNRSITLEFSPGLITGTCCSSGGPPSNAFVISICAVKESDLSGC